MEGFRLRPRLELPHSTRTVVATGTTSNKILGADKVGWGGGV